MQALSMMFLGTELENLIDGFLRKIPAKDILRV